MNKKYLFLILGAIVVISLSSILVLAVIYVNQGDEVTVSISTRCGLPGEEMVADHDTSDGFIRYLYGAWALQDPQEEIIQQQGPQQLPDGTSGYETGTTFIAEDIGRYYFTATIFFVEQQYNEDLQSWETINSGECFGFVGDRTEAIVVNYPSPDLENIIAIINQLFQDWLQTL